MNELTEDRRGASEIAEARDRIAEARGARHDLPGPTDRDEGRQGWAERLEAVCLWLERQIPPLREGAERLRDQLETLVQDREDLVRQVDALGSERDRLAARLEQAEEACRRAASFEAEARGLARTLEQERERLAAMTRANEELEEQARAAQAERDRLQGRREDEERAFVAQLADLRRDLEAGLADAAAARDRAAAARAELEDRVAELEGRIRTADERARRLEAEIRAQRDRIAEADRRADPLRLDRLAAELEEARAANGRLCSLLDVFGLRFPPEVGEPPVRPERSAPIEATGP
jgi:chromosome segregation ATPase